MGWRHNLTWTITPDLVITWLNDIMEISEAKRNKPRNRSTHLDQDETRYCSCFILNRRYRRNRKEEKSSSIQRADWTDTSLFPSSWCSQAYSGTRYSKQSGSLKHPTEGITEAWNTRLEMISRTPLNSYVPRAMTETIKSAGLDKRAVSSCAISPVPTLKLHQAKFRSQHCINPPRQEKQILLLHFPYQGKLPSRSYPGLAAQD